MHVTIDEISPCATALLARYAETVASAKTPLRNIAIVVWSRAWDASPLCGGGEKGIHSWVARS